MEFGGSRRTITEARRGGHKSKLVPTINRVSIAAGCMLLLVVGHLCLGYGVKLVPALCSMGCLNTLIDPLFSYIREVLLKLVGYVYRHPRTPHGKMLKDTIPAALSATVVMLLVEMVMNKSIPIIHASNEDDARKLLVEVATRSLVYSNVLSAVLDVSPTVSRMAGMALLVAVISFGALRGRNSSMCRDVVRSDEAIGSMLWNRYDKKFLPYMFDGECSSLFESMAEHFIPQILGVFGNDDSHCELITFAKISSKQMLWDDANKMVVVPKRGLDGSSLTKGQEFANDLSKILPNVVTGILYLHHRCFSKNALLRSFSLSMIGLGLFVIVRFVDKHSGISESRQSVGRKICAFMKYLAVYLVTVLIFASILVMILHRLHSYHMSQMKKLGNDKIKEMLRGSKTGKTYASFINSIATKMMSNKTPTRKQ